MSRSTGASRRGGDCPAAAPDGAQRARALHPARPLRARRARADAARGRRHARGKRGTRPADRAAGARFAARDAGLGRVLAYFNGMFETSPEQLADEVIESYV